jgi:DNA-binding NtrC family response regulator
VVVTDLRMPGMTGVDLLQRIRRIHGDVPVILATGLETWDLCTAAEAYGAVTCLVKPIELDELVWHIEMALAVRQNAAQADAAI